MTSQEKRCSDHSFETSKVIVSLAGVKAKGSPCKWQRIQGVLAHLLYNQLNRKDLQFKRHTAAAAAVLLSSPVQMMKRLWEN